MTNRKKLAKSVPPLCRGGTSSYVDLCLERLREKGGRISSARMSVIQVLAQAERPLVAKEILERVQEASSAVSLDLVSVYRNLEALVEKELVHQVGHNGGYFPCLHSDCGSRVHVLTRCESCERTSEIHIPDSLSGKLKELIAQTGRGISRISTFHIEGLCGECAKSKPRGGG